MPGNGASEWPPDDVAAVYEVPREPLAPEPLVEQQARLASARVRAGLPISDALIDEVLAEVQSDPSLGIETEAEYAEDYASMSD